MKKLLMISVCAVVMTGSVAHALHFETPAVVPTGIQRFVKLLPAHNEALDKALTVHNLMTELPSLEAVAKQQERMLASKKDLEEYQKKLLKCNEQRLGRFKNPKEVLSKLRKEYQTQATNLKPSQSYPEDELMSPVALENQRLYLRKKKLEENLLTDAMKNGKKWGGKFEGKPRTDVSENISTDIMGTGLEELVLADKGLHNATVALSDFEALFKDGQKDFTERLAAVGISEPDFDATKAADIERVKKELVDLKTQYIADAKEYIAKLDAQDVKYPKIAARRVGQSQNKRNLLKNIKEQFPDSFKDVEEVVDQRTPQQKQMALIAAMEKDQEGKVFLTEVNVLEVDQRIAEMKASENLVKRFEDIMSDMRGSILSQYPEATEFDFSRCGD